MLFFRKDKLCSFTAEEIIEMEKQLNNCELIKKGLSATDKDLAEKLKLKVEYVTNMDDDNEAELVPIESDEYFGLIRLKKELQDDRFGYIHEVIHYIFDVGYGEKVTSSFTRKKKGKTPTQEEQGINYKTAAFIMPFQEIEKQLEDYDKSSPKMDEIRFIQRLQKKYEQSEIAVLRRIREVRRANRLKSSLE